MQDIFTGFNIRITGRDQRGRLLAPCSASVVPELPSLEMEAAKPSPEKSNESESLLRQWLAGKKDRGAAIAAKLVTW